MKDNTSPRSKTKTTDEVIEKLLSHMNFWVDSQHAAATEALASYPEEILHKLATVAEHSVWWEAVSNLIDHREPPSVINEGLRFFPHLTTENAAAARAMIKALHEYPQLPTMDDYSKADERTQEQCLAILTVCDLLEEAPYYSLDSPFMNFRERFLDKHQRYANEATEIVNEKLVVDLLVEHPELAERIGTLIIERQSMDIDLLKEIIYSENPALSDGIL